MAKRFPIRINRRLDKNRKAVVYSIIDPFSKDVVYIGYTVNYKSRISYHLRNGFESNKKALYIRELVKNGFEPIFSIVKEFDYVEEAKLFEIELIDKIKPIYNTNILCQTVC